MRSKFKVFLVLALAAVAVLAVWLVRVHLFPAEVDVPPEQPQGRFETDAAVLQAAANLSDTQAEVLTGVPAAERIVFLTFDGLADHETTLGILGLLDRHNINASFFLPGIRSAEFPETVGEIARRGHHIGNYSLDALPNMDGMGREDAAGDFAAAQAVLREITGAAPTMLKARSTVYTGQVLQAAAAAGLRYAVDSGRFLNFQSFASREAASEYIAGLEPGTVLSVVVDRVLDEMEFTGVQAAPPGRAAPLSREAKGRLLSMVGYLLDAFAYNGFTVLPAKDLADSAGFRPPMDFASLRAQNDGALAPVFTNARTTLRGVAMNFRGIGDEGSFERTVNTLDDLGLAATFFVTAAEARDYPVRVRRLIDAGHTIENGGMTGHDLSRTAEFERAAWEIYAGGRAIYEQFGITTSFFMPPGGRHNDLVLEAAQALGYTVAHYNRNPAGSYVDSAAGLREHFRHGLNRGDIIYADLGNFGHWEQLIPVIADIVTGSAYGIMPMAELYGGQFPAPPPLQQIPGWDAIRANPGFDPDLPRQDDYIRRIDTRDRKVFITFDDWGSDRAVTEVLDALYRLDIKASFFIIAERAANNPNLLHAIAEQGHDIFNHSYAHQEGMTAQEAQADAVRAHQALTGLLGRVPGLVYRPPRLETDDPTLNALFAAGFEHIVSSDVSPHDWQYSAREVANTVVSRAAPGSIVTLHISDHASGGEALDIFVPILRARGFSFPRLSDYLE